jgi:large subunit ribosomal protein L6
MSRIGKAPINIPSGVEIKVAPNNVITVKGPKGELKLAMDPDIKLEIEGNTAHVVRPTDQKRHRSLHGLYRALVGNMVKGTSEGFSTTLEIVGVGYKANIEDQVLELSLGYSHNLFLQLPPEVKAVTTAEKGKSPTITLSSHDKELLGLIVAKIRSYRKPEPYKGKGIKFVGEVLRRKAGKSASSK